MAASGSLFALEYSSETNSFARIAGAKASQRKQPVSTTSYQKPMAVPMTTPIWRRCAGRVTERKQQQRELDEQPESEN